jgi:hypothetical protein
MPRLRLLAASALFTLLAAPYVHAAQQVELHLVDGRVVKGELVSEDDAAVTVKSTLASKSGAPMSITIGYKRDDIVNVVKMANPEDVYNSKSGAAKSADDHLTLARWCKDQVLTDHAIEEAKKTLAIDTSSDGARRLLQDLGLAEVDGKWVKESEWLASQGKERFQGKIMTIDEANALRATMKEQLAVQTAQKALDDKTAHLASIDRQLDAIKKRAPLLDADVAKVTKEQAAAQALVQAATAAKSAYDAAQRAFDSARNQPRPPGGYGPNNPAPNMAQLSQNVSDTQKAYYAARDAAVGADDVVSQCKAKIAALTDEKKTADKKTKDLTASRVTAVKDMDQAQADLNQLTKTAGPAGAPAADPAKPSAPPSASPVAGPAPSGSTSTATKTP